MEAVIDKVIPKSREFKFGSRNITVNKFKFRQFPKVIKIISKIQEHLKPGATEQQLSSAFFSIIADDFESLIEILTLSTSLKMSEIEEIEFDDPEKFKAIMAAVIEVNSDFLARVEALIPQQELSQKA